MKSWAFRIQVKPLAIIGWAGLTALGAAFARKMWTYSGSEALGFGLSVSTSHYGSILVHYVGHSIASAEAGGPLEGVRIHSILGASVYPLDEPDFAPIVHIQRALGGPIASLTFAAALWVIQMRLRPATFMYRLITLMALNNSLVFSIGALLPLGFTDGSTLLYWGKRL